MNVIFHKDAEAELNDAADFYEARRRGLGMALVSEVYLAIQRIQHYPLAWPVMEHTIRRALVRRFPYGIIYIARNDCIYILAVMHLHRSPNYWETRK